MAKINTDQVAIAENGLNLDAIGFGRPAANTIVASVMWSDPNADILGDLTAWLRDYRTNNGGRSPAVMLMGDEVWFNICLLYTSPSPRDS